MGITACYRFRQPVERAVFDQVSRRAQQACALLVASGLPLDTTFTDDYLRINGVGRDQYECLAIRVGHHHPESATAQEVYISRSSEGHSFFTKTSGNKYTTAVLVVLAVAGYELLSHYGVDESGRCPLELEYEDMTFTELRSWLVWQCERLQGLQQAAGCDAEDAAYWGRLAAAAAVKDKLFRRIVYHELDQSAVDRLSKFGDDDD